MLGLEIYPQNWHTQKGHQELKFPYTSFTVVVIAYSYICFKVETKFEEEREMVQSQLMKEQNELLEKYRAREVRLLFIVNQLISCFRI